MFTELSGGQAAGSRQPASGQAQGENLDPSAFIELHDFFPGLAAVFNHGGELRIGLLQPRQWKGVGDHSFDAGVAVIRPRSGGRFLFQLSVRIFAPGPGLHMAHLGGKLLARCFLQDGDLFSQGDLFAAKGDLFAGGALLEVEELLSINIADLSVFERETVSVSMFLEVDSPQVISVSQADPIGEGEDWKTRRGQGQEEQCMAGVTSFPGSHRDYSNVPGRQRKRPLSKLTRALEKSSRFPAAGLLNAIQTLPRG